MQAQINIKSIVQMIFKEKPPKNNQGEQPHVTLHPSGVHLSK
jgi:hypothetical protein